MPGLHRLPDRLTIKFEPAPKVIAMRLQLTHDGAILYMNVIKGKSLTLGQHLGILKGQPFEQRGQELATNKTVVFSMD